MDAVFGRDLSSVGCLPKETVMKAEDKVSLGALTPPRIRSLKQSAACSRKTTVLGATADE